MLLYLECLMFSGEEPHERIRVEWSTTRKDSCGSGGGLLFYNQLLTFNFQTFNKNTIFDMHRKGRIAIEFLYY